MKLELQTNINRRFASNDFMPGQRIMREEYEKTQQRLIFLRGGDPHLSNQFPNFNSIVQTLRRNGNHQVTGSPNTIEELLAIPQLPEIFENVIISFNSYEEEDGSIAAFIILGTWEDFEILLREVLWMADGTFKSLCHPFNEDRIGQAFSISSFFGIEPTRKLYPRLMILMSRRTELAYSQVLNVLFDLAASKLNMAPNDIKLEILSVDFEVAVANAFHKVVSNRLLRPLRVSGCHFHYAESIIHNMISNGLLRDYMDPASRLQIYVSKLIALPFIPVHLVTAAYGRIELPPGAAGIDRFRKFRAYFEKQWFRTVEIQVWNCCQPESYYYTNNAQERLHLYYLYLYGK